MISLVLTKTFSTVCKQEVCDHAMHFLKYLDEERSEGDSLWFTIDVYFRKSIFI